ncbi:MAG: 5-(carboxyamino)imidazole ribonucleotide mutase [Microthrixaceae bacterium]|nr:5-(carboxyamino)imidazole ribonucleotide mutase [Microthrixaceae bacterium]
MGNSVNDDSQAAATAVAAVGVIMGSSSDADVMSDAIEVLGSLCITHELRVVSAHRSPERMFEYARTARERGLSVIIAGAGGAAHLPGMVASLTTLPVIGVPVPTAHLGGHDSLLSIAQMPGGVPVATMAIGGSRNAALMAARILAVSDDDLADRLEEYRLGLVEYSVSQDRGLPR